MEVSEVTGHESCHQENHKTSFQDDQEIVIRDVSQYDDGVNKWALQTQADIVIGKNTQI